MTLRIHSGSAAAYSCQAFVNYERGSTSLCTLALTWTPSPYVPLLTETHRAVGQDCDRVQIAEDLPPAPGGHCSHGYRWSRSGVWRGCGSSLLLVKSTRDPKMNGVAEIGEKKQKNEKNMLRSEEEEERNEKDQDPLLFYF